MCSAVGAAVVSIDGMSSSGHPCPRAPTPDAPIRKNIPPSSTHRANTTSEASDKHAAPKVSSTGGSEKILLGGSSSRKGATTKDVGDVPKWKKQVDALFHFDDLQEKASNQVSSARTAFVQRTTIVNEVL
jgi:hypothetical protein